MITTTTLQRLPPRQPLRQQQLHYSVQLVAGVTAATTTTTTTTTTLQRLPPRQPLRQQPPLRRQPQPPRQPRQPRQPLISITTTTKMAGTALKAGVSLLVASVRWVMSPHRFRPCMQLAIPHPITTIIVTRRFFGSHHISLNNAYTLSDLGSTI